MRTFIAFAVAVLFLPCLSAAPIVGTPYPSLNPVFGTLIDFDDQASGTLIGALEYLGLGLASITETEGVGIFARYGGSQSLPNYIGTGTTGERGTDADLGWDGTILFEFVNPASMVGIGIADSSGGPEILSIFDASFALLDSGAGPAGSNSYAYFSRPSFDIKYFQVSGDYFALDDLQFDGASTTPVPEPGTVVFLMSGLATVALLKRRKRS
jgi:hypothetical protein